MSFESKVIDIRPCKDSIEPCLEIDIIINGFELHREIWIPIDALLLSDDLKILSRPIITYQYFNVGVAPCITVDYIEYLAKRGHKTHYDLRLICKAVLTPKALDYIESRRQQNKYKRVELKLKVKFLVLHSDVIWRERLHYLSFESGTIPVFGIPSGTALIYIDMSVFNEQTIDIFIEERKWIEDFMPALNIGRYAVIELPQDIPIPKIAEGKANKAIKRFRKCLEALESARDHLFMDPGAAQTALRNALIELCEGMICIDLAKHVDKGCTLDTQYLVDKLGFTENQAKALVNIYTSLKSIVQRGPPTAPHMAEERLETYQVLSLIGITSYFIKLILDTINRRLRTSS